VQLGVSSIRVIGTGTLQKADLAQEGGHHFTLAAKHHRLAAEADHKDDEVNAAHHGYIAYGHTLHGVQFAEEAAQEDLSADHADEDHGNEKHNDHSHDDHGHSEKK
jgi:hypothetical protein